MKNNNISNPGMIQLSDAELAALSGGELTFGGALGAFAGGAVIGGFTGSAIGGVGAIPGALIGGTGAALAYGVKEFVGTWF